MCACTLCYTAGKKRESATSLKAECDRLDKENYRLLQSQGNLAQLGAKMTNGTRRFRTFFELERKGRERQLIERRKLAAKSRQAAEARAAHEIEVRRAAERAAMSTQDAQVHTHT